MTEHEECNDQGDETNTTSESAEEKASNKQLTATTSEADFVGFRSTRDAQLNLPRLIYQALQVNMRAGRLPKAEENGERYLKLPIAERE